ncbi:hypothetical protein BGZ80_001994 [Entomortierella chlamydospora]|uniref:Uncharacterized protein n=1 Tax=Entomortierella chlamydospora TaxID=101097 RepID=A0A9P6N1G4_9FUNG|nr:hypothetical protein BGZ79_003778 [Entomortierella chlamydospora]KAG0021633.1 hypothetical protein BGZ80_001994 [Entomortierella chlamydospora]
MILVASALRWKAPSIEAELGMVREEHNYQSKLIKIFAITFVAVTETRRVQALKRITKAHLVNRQSMARHHHRAGMIKTRTVTTLAIVTSVLLTVTIIPTLDSLMTLNAQGAKIRIY